MIAAWLETRQCAACHHVPLPLWALGEAARQGYAVDEEYVSETVESLLGSNDKLMASKIFPDPAAPPDPRPQGRGLNMGLPFLAVAARSLPSLNEGQRQSLNRIAEEIIKKQVAAGGAGPDTEDVPEAPLPDTDPLHLPAVLAEAFGLSTSEARRLIAQGAVRVDGEVVAEVDVPRTKLDGALVQAGKRRFVRLVAPA